MILILSIAAVSFIGPLAGMSIDQLVKQLPARHRIGAAAFSAYMRAADLRNGVFLYAFFGVGAASTAIGAAIFAHVWALPATIQMPLTVSVALAILHSGTTAFAAPTAFSQHRIAMSDEPALARVLDRFVRWHRARTLLQVLQFAAALWALIEIIQTRA